MNVPAVNTVIEEVISVVDHVRFVPDAVKVDVPQPSKTVITGVEGTITVTVNSTTTGEEAQIDLHRYIEASKMSALSLEAEENKEQRLVDVFKAKQEVAQLATNGGNSAKRLWIEAKEPNSNFN